MAGEHPLVLNRFSKKQAAASTGAMAMCCCAVSAPWPMVFAPASDE